jgi:hypothetical protein
VNKRNSRHIKKWDICLHVAFWGIGILDSYFNSTKDTKKRNLEDQLRNIGRVYNSVVSALILEHPSI